MNCNNKKKKVTIKDIADACGVSTATVSYVVNGREDQRISPETWKRVLHKVHIMGYESSAVAKALATGNSGMVGLYAPNAASDPDEAHSFAAFTQELAARLEGRGYALRLIDDSCVSQTINTLDAIVALNVDRLAFRKIGFNCFYPLICVDGVVDDLFLFYQVNTDFAAAAAAARQLGNRACAVLRPFAEQRLNRRVEESFDSACFLESKDKLGAFLSAEPGDTVFVAMGAMLAEQLRSLTSGRVLSLCPGGDIELPYKKKAKMVAGLVYDTIRKSGGAEHDIRLL